MVSPFFKQYLREEIGGDLERCLEYINYATSHSFHLARIRSVAKAAGFCAYYGRMAEKMGVFEVLGGPGIGRGREVHRILGIASLLMFSEKSSPSHADVDGYISRAIRELGIDVDKGSIDHARVLLNNLVRILPKAKRLLGLSPEDPLFPIVEQQFMSFKDRMYGAPDLILENLEHGKAMVVEWKTYPVGGEKGRGGSPTEYEIAQVIAYSILEARRMGLKKYREVFEAITGLSHKELGELRKECVTSNSYGCQLLLERSRERLRILPMVVGPGTSIPPHPLLYSRTMPGDIIKRFERMYRLFRGVVLAAEFLALQITNVPEAVQKALGREDPKEVSSDLKSVCRAKRGDYPVYSFTPFRYLRAGKPGSWDRYPCRACYFSGDGGPCDFYFGQARPGGGDYFDKLMWWARYKVYSKRERDLLNYMAMDTLFRWLLKVYGRDRVLKRLSEPARYEVSMGSSQVMIKSRSIPNVVVVKEGNAEIAKFRFDIFDIQDAEVTEDCIELRRPLRDIERQEGKVGLLRKTVAISIVDLRSRVSSPVMAVNTFVMLDDTPELEGGSTIAYKGYVPSYSLQYSFELFGYYVDLYRRRGDSSSVVVAFEAPVDLTIMELRAIDSLHRFINSVKRGQEISVTEVEEEVDLGEVRREVEVIERYIPRHEVFVRELLEILREKILPWRGEGR